MNGISFQIELLKRVLDTSVLRYRVIANNVANVNTPNYKRVEVAFEDDLAKAIGPGGKIDRVQPKIVETLDTAERVDGNTVDIDREMSELGKNTLFYQAAAQILTSRLAILRSAVTGRS
jgi:flagellar basal-body rod protein FlgB